MIDESIKNILEALYEESSTIKMYVDAIAAGKPVPYTILTKSTDNEINEEIVRKLRERKAEFDEMLPQNRDSEVDSMLDMIDEILDEEFILIEDEYEVVMFKDDTIVEGSRQVVTGIKIKSLKQYAVFKGYEFSARKIE